MRGSWPMDSIISYLLIMMNRTGKYVIRPWEANDNQNNSQNNMFIFSYSLTWAMIVIYKNNTLVEQD